MKKERTIGIPHLLLCLVLALIATRASAQAEHDRTGSPYFLVNAGEESGVELFPLESTKVDVAISGVIAAVTIHQTYRNRGDQPIEGVYLFPASTKAAVNALRMRIGERVVAATIKEKQAAKAVYRQAKREGKRSTLLQQQRPNVFQMNLANIMPGDRVEVELSYTELLVPEEGEYRFIYPTVVGPRYNGEAAEAPEQDDRWVANPYLREGTPTPFEFDITLSLSTGVPIQALASPTHRVHLAYQGEASATLALDEREKGGGNRDFILAYRLQGQAIESGLLLHRGERENFFLLMAQPPKRTTVEAIPPREYIFIIDVSGSMHGFPLETSKRLMGELLPALRPQDAFNLMFFSGGSSMLAERSLPATRSNIEHALLMLNNRNAGGGTRMLDAIQRAMAVPAEPGVARSFVIVTDGYVSIEKDAFEYVRQHLGSANFFSFGIGSGINRFLIEGLARAGRAAPFVVTEPGEAAAAAQRFRRYIQSPLLTNIEIDFDGLDVYDSVPESVPDLMAERPLIVFGKWRGDPLGSIRLRGYSGKGPFEQHIPINDPGKAEENPALRYLWARQQIAELGDFQKLAPHPDRVEAIKRLGLDYSLLTAYTSFVAVDSEIVNPGGGGKRSKQPLPLPKGVSNQAVGGQVPVAPEPGIYALLAVMAGVGGWRLLAQRRRRGAHRV